MFCGFREQRSEKKTLRELDGMIFPFFKEQSAKAS